jgi:hypothetical protein
MMLATLEKRRLRLGTELKQMIKSDICHGREQAGYLGLVGPDICDMLFRSSYHIYIEYPNLSQPADP